MSKTREIVAFVIVCLGLYSLLALAVWWTRSPWPLLGLIVHPTYKDNDDGRRITP